MQQEIHLPVLLEETIQTLAPQVGESYLDLTAGYGGHASAICSKIGVQGDAVLVDRDSHAIKTLTEKFGANDRIEIRTGDYLSISKLLNQEERKFDVILADIGLSSPHLDNPARGFSFMQDGPLDMRMDQTSKRTAAMIVNSYTRQQLADVLHHFGEVRGAYRLSDMIMKNRPYRTTKELASVIPGPHEARMRILAQVFQALRIEVNDELGQLRASLPLWVSLLRKNGRLGVITFHSLEDRIVKEYFKDHGSDNAFDADLNILTNRPIEASKSELVFNPRARSAKFRVAQRK